MLFLCNELLKIIGIKVCYYLIKIFLHNKIHLKIHLKINSIIYTGIHV